MPVLIIKLLRYACSAVEVLVLIRCVLSWIPGINNQFSDAVYRVTEPMLAPIRNLLMRIINPRNIMIDFSPIVLLILIGLIDRIGYMILIRSML